MANAWGELSWNAGNWGDQNNVTISVTGFGNSIAQGQAGGFPFPGWGSLTWNAGSWGDTSNVSEQLTGYQLNISQGDALGVPNQGWGSDSWGVENWGESGNVVSLTGLGLTVDSGEKESWGQAGWNASTTEWGGPYISEVAIGQQVDVSGRQLNIQNLGTPLIFSATEVFLDQNPLPNLTVAEGTIDPGPDVALTGIGLTTDVGTVSAYNEQGWGRDDWGTEVWGAQGIWSFVDVTGQQLNTNLGNENIRTDVDVELDTEYNPGWGAVAWGAQTWGLGTADMALAMPQPGAVDPEPDESLDGQQVNIALGEETITADANIVINNDILPTFTAEADAQLSTAQAKFGPSSLLLDGTGDFVQSTATSVVQNDFTIEFFAYATNFAQDAYLWDNSLSNQGFAFSVTSAGQLRLIQNNTILAQTSSPSLNNNQWNHFALVQNGSLLNLYINGTSKLQYATGGDSYPGQSYKIGTNEGETQFFNGYIDEFRSSNIARYTTTFTPPTSAFTADGNTISLLHFDGANGSTNIVNSTGSEIPRIALGLGQGQAELEAVTIAEITGQQLNTSLNNAVAGASAQVFPTGNQLTITSGSINVQSWQIVDTGISVTWNEIDTAA